MAEEKKKKSYKMTWNRLKNDASISKTELPRIAKAFGITPPKGWKDTKTREVGGPTGRERSRTEGMEKPKAKAKPTAKAKSSMQKAFSKPRTKLTAEKPKAKKRAPVSAAADPSPKATRAAPKSRVVSRRRTQYETGTERGFEEGTYRQRVKAKTIGGKSSPKAGKERTILSKVKQPGAARMSLGGRGGLSPAGKMKLKIEREAREKHVTKKRGR